MFLCDGAEGFRLFGDAGVGAVKFEQEVGLYI